MKLYRFMSFEEFRKYYFNIELNNTINHNRDRKQKTNSIGFCFFRLLDCKPEKMFHSVTGIVDTDICAIFETDRQNVRKGMGRYCQEIENTFYRKIIYMNEYSTTRYDKNTFKLDSFAIPIWNSEKWDWKKI